MTRHILLNGQDLRSTAGSSIKYFWECIEWGPENNFSVTGNTFPIAERSTSQSFPIRFVTSLTTVLFPVWVWNADFSIALSNWIASNLPDEGHVISTAIQISENLPNTNLWEFVGSSTEWLISVWSILFRQKLKSQYISSFCLPCGFSCRRPECWLRSWGGSRWTSPCAWHSPAKVGGVRIIIYIILRKFIIRRLPRRGGKCCTLVGSRSRLVCNNDISIVIWH